MKREQLVLLLIEHEDDGDNRSRAILGLAALNALAAAITQQEGIV
jgi:hypothetical protein